MPVSPNLASRAPFDAANFILPAEWHTLADLLGTDAGVLMLQDGRIMQMNPVLAQQLGYAPEELAGRLLEAILPDEEAGAGSQALPGDGILALRGKWGGRVSFEVLENRIDPLSDGRCSILVLRLQPDHEDSLPAPGARLLAITEQLPDMVLVCDSDAGIRYANRAFGQLAGPHGDALLTLVHHDDRQHVSHALERAAAADTVGLEMRLRRADGGWSRVAGTVVNLLSHPDVHGLLVNVRDISEQVAQQQRTESERKRQLHYLNRLLRIARKPRASLDSTLKVIVKSAAKAIAVHRCAYWEADDDRPARCLSAYDDVRQNFVEEVPDALFTGGFEPLMRKVLAGGGPLALDDVDRDPRSALCCEYFHAHGIKAAILAPVLPGGVPAGVLVFTVSGEGRPWRKDEAGFAETAAGLVAAALEEITRSRAESRLRNVALHDTLTGLPNRDYLRQQAAELFPRLSARSNTLAAFVVDLDGFTEVNDRHGLLLGDELLKAVALRLKNAVRRDDLLVRLDGDAFLLLARDLGDMQVAEDIAQQVTDSMRNPYSLQGRLLRVSASVGIALYPRDGADLDTLVRKAGQARYLAKAAGHGQYRTFVPAAEEATADAPSTQLRRAVERHELRHYFQPQVDLHDGRIRGVEALLRWQHPRHGLLLPASFLPLAEQGGGLPALTAWALADVCRQAAAWQRLGIDGFTVAVKLSAAQLADPGLPAALQAALRDNRLPPRQLECEVKEALLRDPPQPAGDTLAGLAAIGVTVSIDDFTGAGLDAALLGRYPVHKVKIDASPSDGAQGEDGREDVDAALGAAHRLGLEVVAKGVETSQQVEYLGERGCDIGLGYHYTQPLTADQFEKWLIRR